MRKQSAAGVTDEKFAELLENFESLKRSYDKLLFEHEKLRRQIIGPKRERVSESEGQLSLPDVLDVLDMLGVLPTEADGDGDDGEALIAAKRAARDADQNKTKKKPRRRELSLSGLPIERIVIEPEERRAPGGEDLIRIGEQVTEYVDRKAATMVRVQWVRPKYRRPSVEPTKLGAPLARASRREEPTILIAPLPLRPIAKCLAGPGLLAHTLVSKYADHLPWYRLSSILEREGLPVARSVLSDWVSGSVEWLGNVTAAMWEDAKQNASYSIVDATGVLVQAKQACRRRSFYVLVVPGQHVLFRYAKKNDGKTVAKLFEGFRGYIHADAASVYHELYAREPDVTEVGCWSHARRGFFEAYSRDRERSLTAIGYIGQLYEAHRASLDDKGNVDVGKRRRLSRPVLARLLWWVRRERRLVPKGTPMYTALGYVKRQRKPLLRFLDDGRLRLDTNLAEGALRRVAKGRDNWLFCATDEGARWNTVVVSLIASCQMHNVEPWAYLRDILAILPVWDLERALELAPKNWAATSATDEVRALLRQQLALGRDEG